MSDHKTPKSGGDNPPGSDGGLIIPSETERLQAKILEEKQRESNRRKLQILFNGIVAITGLLTVGVLYYQACVMQRTLEQVKAQSSASRKANWLDQRAWVSFVAADTPTLQVNQPITLHIRLENTGRTPAEKVNGDITFEIFRKGEEKTFRHPRTEIVSQFDAGILVPGHRTMPPILAINQRTGQVERYTAEVAKSLADGNAFIMAHGKVNYVDAWRVNHQLKFCVIPFGQTPSDFTACEEYGEIDHNEPPQ